MKTPSTVAAEDGAQQLISVPPSPLTPVTETLSGVQSELQTHLGREHVQELTVGTGPGTQTSGLWVGAGRALQGSLGVSQDRGLE